MESEGGHISEIELRKRIRTELEAHLHHIIDKKTLHNILDKLRKEGLVLMKSFKVTIYQDEVKEDVA